MLHLLSVKRQFYLRRQAGDQSLGVQRLVGLLSLFPRCCSHFVFPPTSRSVRSAGLATILHVSPLLRGQMEKKNMQNIFQPCSMLLLSVFLSSVMTRKIPMKEKVLARQLKIMRTHVNCFFPFFVVSREVKDVLLPKLCTTATFSSYSSSGGVRSLGTRSYKHALFINASCFSL